MPARSTFYNGLDDQYGSTTARPNPMTGKAQAIPGQTIAVDPKVIPYGSLVQVARDPEGKDVVGTFTAHDTGSAVVAKKASGGRKPVIDFYTTRKDLGEANARLGDNIYYRIASNQ